MARRIVLGVGGSIAAYKAVGLARLLSEAGFEVRAIPTRASLEFVGTATWEAITGHLAPSQVFTTAPERATADHHVADHLAAAHGAELAIVAPATADLIARMACGIADDLLTTTLLALTCPVLIAPAMHSQMWLHPATQDNIATLRRRGVRVVGPESGRLTGHDSGPGRMSEPDELYSRALAMLGHGGERRDMAGLRVVVTAGGTREPLDPVRFLTNRSSGLQGRALAEAARDRGAQVTLVAGAMEIAPPEGVEVVRVETARELADAVGRRSGAAEVVVMAAAVADFAPAEVAGHKLKKGPDGQLTLRLVANPDILAGLVAGRRPGQTIVGFAAETGEPGASVLELGRAKAIRKGADLLVVNEVGEGVGFGTADNAVIGLDGAGDECFRASGTKREVADAIWDAVIARRTAPTPRD